MELDIFSSVFCLFAKTDLHPQGQAQLLKALHDTHTAGLQTHTERVEEVHSAVRELKTHATETMQLMQKQEAQEEGQVRVVFVGFPCF